MLLLVAASVAALAVASLDECHTHPLCQVETDEAPVLPPSTSAPLEDTEAAPEETQIEPTTLFADTLSVENQVTKY